MTNTPGYSELDLCPSCLQIHGAGQPCRPEPVALDSAGDAAPMDVDGGGWPGDGSGTDDLADMNANEADDYQNE